METRFLETFIAVVNAGSIAGAAKRLNLTAATIAQRVGVLEMEMGVPLLTRSGRVSVPTTVGRLVAERAREVVIAVRDLHVSDSDDAVTGELRVGAISTVITGILPAALKRLAPQFPELAFYIEPNSSQEIYEAVLEGDLDAGLLVRPNFELPKSCIWTTLRIEPLVVVVPENCSGNPLTLLSQEPFIRYARCDPVGALVADYVASKGIRPRDGLELNSLEAIAVMVDQGLGVTLIPDWLPPWLANLKLRKLALPPPVPTREIGLIRRTASPRTHLVQILLHAIRETMAIALEAERETVSEAA